MKRLSVLLLVALFSGILMVSGCNSIETSSSSGVTSTSIPSKGVEPVSSSASVQGTLTGTPSSAASIPASTIPDVIKLTLGSGLYPSHPLEQINKKWADKIKAETNGRVEITLVDTTAGSQKGDFSMMGKVDISVRPAYMPGPTFTISPVLSSFFYGTDVVGTTQVFNGLWKEFPEIRAEYTKLDVKRLFGHSTTEMYISTRDRPVTTLDGFKGLQMVSAMKFDWIDQLGAVQKVVPELEVYPDLQKGAYEGTVGFLTPTHMENLKTLSLADVTQYSTNMHVSAPPLDYYAIKMTVWNSLPEDIQKIIEDSFTWMEAELQQSQLDQEKEAKISAEAKGHRFVELSPEDLNKFYSLMEEKALENAAILDAKGLPGTKIFQETRRLTQEYTK